MDKNSHRLPIAKRSPTNRITPSRKKLQSFLATPLKSLCWRLNPQTQHEASRKGWDIAQDGCIVSRARGALSFFSFFQPLAGIERKRGWRRTGKCLSTTAFNPFLTPRHRQRGMGERENREHTHTYTHGVRNIYSKASRALARCTKRKLSCRPEINYRVSRGWIRKGDGSCVVTTR